MGLIHRTLLLGGLMAAVGCSDRPSAPVLAVEAVYRHDESGLRFLTPDGWAPLARVDLPAGRLDKPTRMVAYVQAGAAAPAEIELYAVDLPAEANLVNYLLKEQRIGPEKWQVKSPPADTLVRGVKASRFELRAGAGKTERRRDVVAFRRGGRLFLFLFTGSASATADVETFQRCVNSATWD
ncbi:MAG: hypothetical protein U0871_09935 [Gemmataceae bacterium]